MREPKVEKECATCAHAGESMLQDPCKRCLRNTMRFGGEIYPDWEPQENPE